MGNINKTARQEIIFQLLRARDGASGMSAADIHKAMKNEGIVVDLRTIRRDLLDLSTTHGLVSDDGRPERYYPSKDFRLKYGLHLNEGTLQVLLIALNNLKFTSHEYFGFFASEAETAIYNSLEPGVVEALRESKKKYHFDFSTAGKPTESDLEDFKKIMVAVRENRLISCLNDSPYKEKEYNAKIRTFAPHMFVLTAGIPYIVVEDQEDKQFKTLRVTRISKVRLSKKTFNPTNSRFRPEDFIGGWGGVDEESVRIRATCDKAMADYFRERVVHRSQRLRETGEGKYELSFECPPSHALTRLLSSFGGHIESIEPRSLLEEVKGIWKSGLKKHSA